MTIKTFPTLYAKTNTGAIQQWNISVSTLPAAEEFTEFGVITTSYGQVDGKQQVTTDTIREGKNPGKKNATTAVEQAVKEAEAKWRKKKEREGMVEDIERARAGSTDQAGGIPPMLAHPLDKVLKHTKFPCDAQRKYNGNRLIVMYDGTGGVTLWSRRQLPIDGVPHIQAFYEKFFDGHPHPVILDGECYRHGWSLQKISGFFRKKGETKPGFEELRHYVYDIPSHPGTWEQRREALERFADSFDDFEDCPVEVVETDIALSEEGAWALHDTWVQEGYEGVILRQHRTPYEAGKRSQGLAKLKKFIDQEFIITGVKEGRGKFEGKAVFECITAENKPFDCCAPGDMAERAEYFANPGKVIGKNLTVRFFEWSDEKKPLCCTGVAIRDYE